MKIVVLGSGVVGVTTAWYLTQEGHEVEVIDRQPDVAMETSHANAGEVSPGYATPWAAPGIPMKALKWMFQRHAPLVLHARLDPTMWRWMGMMLGNCNASRYEINKSRMVRVAEYSRDMLKQLRADLGLAYDHRTRGTLEVVRTQKSLDGLAKDTAILDRFNVPYEILDRAGCVAAEPGLARVQEKIIGGLRLPGDETGDCLMFTRALAEKCKAAGVVFRHNVNIAAIEHDGSRITSVRTTDGTITGDGYVVTLGSYAPFMLKPLGIDVPIYPIKGYSITVPVTNSDAAPQSTVMDEAHKVAITRLGDRIRVAGMAELAGHDLSLSQRRRETIEHVYRDLFPDGGPKETDEFWTGLRAMTPDSVPVLGPSRYSNLYLNIGHGTLGWTMSCGAARVVADVVSGKKPAIDMEGLTVARFGGAVSNASGRPQATPLSSPAFNNKA
jgi:D-amino-acid dehydrogenase